MATIILLQGDDLTKQTIIGGNVDTDRYWPSVKAAQQLYVKPLLGIELYNKICDDFFNDTLSGTYLTIYEDYVKEMVIHSSAEIYLSNGAYMVSNNGITKLKTEDSETISKEEIDYLVEASRKLYESYKKDFLDFMKDNGDDVPEWSDKNKPSTTHLNVGGWHLKKSNKQRCFNSNCHCGGFGNNCNAC